MNILEHLKERHMNISLYPNSHIDEEHNIATFFLFSLKDRKLVGYQQYNPLGDKKVHKCPREGKYFTYLSEPAVWGLESIKPDTNTIAVCEGIFKACRFHNYSIASIATLTNNPKAIKQQILSLAPNVVVVADPDKSGEQLHKYGHRYIVPDKPVDEMSAYEFDEFIYLNFYNEVAGET